MITVLVSAVVALAVSLTSEYLFKPWLEVRKEEILEKRRRLRMALTHWRAVERGLRQLIDQVRHETTGRHEDVALHASLAEHVAGLKATIAVSDSELRHLHIADMADVIRGWEGYESLRTDGRHRGNHQLDEEVKVCIQPISERTFELIAIPRWRRRQRRQTRRRPLEWHD